MLQVEEEPLIGVMKESKRRDKLCYYYKLYAGPSPVLAVWFMWAQCGMQGLGVLRDEGFGFPWLGSSWPVSPVYAQQRGLFAGSWIICEW